jgi:predicted RNA methylase
MREVTGFENLTIWSLENLEGMYGLLDYRGKSVLDIGADWGTTACFFLRRGARSVIAVEGDLSRYNRLVENIGGDCRVFPFFCWINNKAKARRFLEYNAEIVKIDCEGCEDHFLEIADSVFSMPEAYVVETHSWEATKRFKEKFAENGYVLLREQVTNFAFLPFRILTAAKQNKLLSV